MEFWILRIKELAIDWCHLVRREGLKSTYSNILKEILTLPYKHIKYIVFALPLLDSFPKVSPKAKISVRTFKMKDLDFVREEYLPSEANLCQRRLQIGHLGFLASIDGKPVGYTWLCTDVSLERIKLNLSKGEILINDAFTTPEFRNLGVKTALAVEAIKKAYDLGYERLIVYIDEKNAPSINVWEKKFRAEIITQIDYIRIGIWRKTRCI
jgi:GNAT superfamily N-acetyltransferase